MSMTAERFEDIPAPLALLVESVVPVPALRDRPSDILPLARHIARRLRGRDVAFTAAADRALGDHSWPGNVEELVEVVRHAVHRATSSTYATSRPACSPRLLGGCLELKPSSATRSSES
jgi:DNA-binding NtrC family response regulator